MIRLFLSMSCRWYERSEFTQTVSGKRAKQRFAHYGSPLLIFALLIAGMTGEVLAEETDPLCKVVANHAPRSDVAYQAGVDAYGNAVVPADLNASGFQVPNVIKVPLNIDLAKRMAVLVDGIQLEAPLGMIEIHQDGRVRYNDQDWTAPVKTLCGQSHKVVDKVEQATVEVNSPASIITPVQDGLQTQDAIRSSERVIEVVPTVAIPPQDVNIEQIEIDEPEDNTNDVIEGGEYREIFYNE